MGGWKGSKEVVAFGITEEPKLLRETSVLCPRAPSPISLNILYDYGKSKTLRS